MKKIPKKIEKTSYQLLDEHYKLVGRVKNVKEVERLLIPFFELFMSAPKDELH